MPSRLETDPSASSPAALRGMHTLPGPPGLPIFGNMLQAEPMRFHQTAERWSERYGNLFRIKMGNKQVLVVADAEVIGRVLRDRPAPFGRGVRLRQIAAEMGITGLFTANTEVWQRKRPMVMSAFAPNNIRRYFPALVAVTQRLETRWRRAARAGTAIDLQADLMRYTVDVTAGLAFGAAMNTLESDDNVIQQHLNAIFPMVGQRLLAPLPYWRWFKLARDRSLDRHLVEVHRAVAGFIDAARARLRADPERLENPDNLIEAMIAARDAPGSALTDQDVAGNVLTMLLAGEDTTANTLAWLLHLLSDQPAVREQLHAESARVLGPESVATEFALAGALTFAEACTHEAMRLKPVAPFLLLEAYEDAEVAGIRVPRGAMVMLLTRRAATDGRNFAEPLRFHPERWLEDEELSGRSSAPKRASMPFGGGPRLCPGRYLALLEIKMVVSMLFRNFEIDSVATADGSPVEERLPFTMEPVGLRMKLRERAQSVPPPG